MSSIERNCLRIIATSAAGCSIPLSAIVLKSRAWTSAMFTGQHLTIAVRGGDDTRLDEWLAALPEAELVWLGHFVASVEVIEHHAGTATIDLLVVED